MKTEISTRVGLYPGSFDPFTLGHLDIIRRAAGMFDLLYIAVLVNVNKKSLFSEQERVKIIELVTKDIPNVRVISFSGMQVDCCREYGAGTIIRGLRSVTDFEYELQIAQTNRILCPEVETIFLTTDLKYAYLSSSAVREVASFGGPIDEFLPEEVIPLVKEKYNYPKENNK